MFSELINMEKDIKRKDDGVNNLPQLNEHQNKIRHNLERNLISETAIEQVKDCTYFLYGDMKIEQTMFICGRCDFYQLDPLCEACYNHCHKECYTRDNKKAFGNLLDALAPTSQNPDEANSKIEKETDFKRKVNKKETKRIMQEQQKSSNKGKKIFACNCGKKHKHQKHKNNLHQDHKEVERCNLENEMPASLCTTKAKSYCQECDTQICAMCASGCHYFHHVMSALPSKEDGVHCYCSNSNHQMNDFLLNSYFNENTLKVKFHVLISSKTKTMNLMFLTRDLFHNLSNFLQKFLKTSTSNLLRTLSQRNSLALSNINQPKGKAGNPEESDSKGLKLDDNMRKFLDVSGIFFKILYEKHDKCYFYNEELKKIFSYHNCFLLIEHLCEVEYDTNNSLMILNLVGIFFYLHLKADFQRVKNFTISDFMGSKIVTRLQHKSKLMILHSQEKDTEVNTQNLNPYANLKKYFHESSSLQTISIKLTKIITDCLPTLNIFANSTLYEVCLRLINFGLKKMYFTKANLKSLIDNLFIFTNEFHQILFLPKNVKNLKKNLEATKFVFYYLIKIFYLIAVNYNDMVTEKLVTSYKLTNKLSADVNRKKFIHSNEKYGDKLLKMILKTVTIVSESYTYDIQLDRKVINICNESLKIFSITENFYMGQINRLKDKEILAKYEDSFNPSVSFSLATKLTNKIESIFIEDYTDVLSRETELYLEIDQIFRELLRSVPTDSDPHANRNREEMDNPKKAKIFHYKIKLLNFFSDVLGYSSREEFYFMYSSLLNSEAFVNDIISDNFDEIISKYFSLFKLKSLDQNDINSAFSIYLLYFMDRRGVEHFCTGKNLSIITKLFASPKNAKLLLTDETKLEFLFLLVKGIFLYKIDLSNDKCIYNITAIIELVLTKDDEEMRNNANNLPYVDEIPFKAKQRMIKIFSMLKDSFEFEEFENIQEIFFSKFRKLLDPELFKSHIKEYQSKLLDPKMNPKRESVVKLGNEFNLQRLNENEINYNSEKGYGTKYSTANFDEKTKLIGGDMDSVRPNLLQDEEILKLNDNNFTTTMYKAKSYALKFYFSFFHFLSIDTYYIFYDFPEEEAQLDEIHKFVDLEYMREILGKSFLPLNYRTNLLVFLRTFFFINILDSKGKNEGNSYITTEEMYKYLNKLYSPEELPEIEQKAQLIFKIVAVMDIFAAELETFNKLLKSEPYYFEDVEQYLIQIVYSIKVLSDFVYYQKTIWENVNWYIYKIGKRFLQKANIIKNMLLNIKSRGKVGDILDEDLEITKKMEHINFNIYNKDLIYNHISDSLIDILKATNVDKNFKLEKYLKEHDKKIKNDFTPTGSITWKGYDELYTKKEKNNETENKVKIEKLDKTKVEDEHKIQWIKDKKKTKKNPLVKILKKVYKTTFIRVYDTCLMRVINTFKTKDDSVDYRRIILDYFIKFMSSDPENKKFFVKVSNKIYTEETTLTLLIIIVKLLYYDTKNTQNKFEYLNERYVDPTSDESVANEEETPDICKQFFKSFFNKLQKIFVLNFSTSINFFMFDRYSEISELNKLMIQFLQLLAEGFNVNFKSKIFELKLTRTESISIFDIIYSQFKTAYNLMGLHVKIANNNELSHYKLLVLFSNIVDFFVEYIEGTDLSIPNKITEMMENFFDDNIHKSLLVIINNESESITPEKIGLCKKLLLRVKNKILEVVIAFVENGVDEVFLKKIQKELPMTRLFEEIQHYLHELLETIQNNAISDNSDHYQHLMNVYKKNKNEFRYFLTKLYLLDENFSESLDLNFCLKLFMYLSILSDVYGIKTINEHFALRINKAISHDSVTSFLSPQAFKVFKFMKNIVRNVEVKNIEDNKISKTFFFRPPITFYLSDPSKRQFMDTVDRESRFSKLSSLIKQTDYFMFEMVYYSHFNYIGRKINEYFDLYYLEILNYCFIIIQQILLLVHFYVSTSVPTPDYQIALSEKYVIQKDSYILALIQIGYISVILIIWLFFQFPLKLFYNLMDNDSQFLFNKEGEEKRDIIDKYNETSAVKGTLSHIDFLRNVNRNSRFWQMIKISLLDCLFINREVNTFAFTLIFIILYLTTSSAIFIVFPILFILNIIPILFGMFVALRTKWKQLLTMLIFTFLCIYFYMWISFYFIYPLFTYSNIYLPGQGNQNTENLCTSAIECYLTMIDAGFRSGGGIGDQLPFASWEQDTSFYMIHFFYKMTFYIFIILILSNSCFGIIIDAFSDLRDRTNAIEEDKKNICYTCQLSRDNSLNKGINFDLHTKKQHYPWNYVYFITHLLLNDPNEFNHSEYYAWEKVTSSTNDVGWIPGETEDNDN